MTDQQQVFAKALARVKFPPRCDALKFANDMICRAQYRPALPLTPKQHKYLCSTVVRFGRQINGLLVDAARKELARIAAEEKAV